MREVAALAGVAIKTVSRVMNEVPTVDPDLAERVREAADMLGYRPNLTASSLRMGAGRTATIGLLLEDVSNPFSAALLRAVEDDARGRGVQVLIASLDRDPDREREMARTLIDRQVDGLIIVPAGHDQSYLPGREPPRCLCRFPRPRTALVQLRRRCIGQPRGRHRCGRAPAGFRPRAHRVPR
jgi:LacI family transcriptional regulator